MNKPLRPYLFNAYYHWILDSGCTPYLLVNAEYPDTQVPQEFVKDGRIILNISDRSIGEYEIKDEWIMFSARFQGNLRDVCVPFGAAVALYAQESGEGIMFQEEAFYAETQYLERQAALKNSGKTRVKKKATHLKLVK